MPSDRNASLSETVWRLSHRADPTALKIADRHYSRQKPGTPQFVKPGRCVVLLTVDLQALWVTSWPFPEYVKHEWPDAWECSFFHNLDSSPHVASELVEQAVAVTRFMYGEPPSQGFITTVDPTKIRSTNPGYCYKRAGWRLVGQTKDRKLPVLQLPRDEMPEPVAPIGYQEALVV